ncbi:hypothetical protein B0H14DRAFT_2573961 [Mycena olivaceomarginata]|nr:hypothetical protein B0H14DRAFT_2573961 [Mycena olivaceomarginata]
MIVTQTHPEKRVQNKAAASMNPISSAVPKFGFEEGNAPVQELFSDDPQDIKDLVILSVVFDWSNTITEEKHVRATFFLGVDGPCMDLMGGGLRKFSIEVVWKTQTCLSLSCLNAPATEVTGGHQTAGTPDLERFELLPGPR